MMGKAMSTTGGIIIAIKDHSQKPIFNTHIQSLPNEILALIFARLPAEDCSSVRLVCKSWYELSFDQVVTKNQKFVFREDNSSKEIAEFLLQMVIISHTVQLNIEFHDLSMDNLTPLVWEECGHRMHTLRIRKCNFDYLTFTRVIVHRINLTDLIIEQNEDYDEGDTNSPFMLKDIVDHGLVRPNLRTFAWFHTDCHLSMVVLQRIMSVFPSIKYFGTGPKPAYNYQLPLDISGYDWSSYSNFNECLNLSVQLNRIVFNKSTDGTWMEHSILKPEWSSRLIEFQTQLNYRNLPDFGRDLLFRFFVAQKNLEIVTLNELKGDEAFTRELMFCIFENCPKLRELQLRFNKLSLLTSVTFQTYPEFARFFSFLAKLKCFVVNFNIGLNFSSKTLCKLPPTSFLMERLHLDQTRTSKVFCCTVLMHCSRLKYLFLTVVFDNIVQEIFKNSDLQVLILFAYEYPRPNIGDLTDYGFTGKSETRGGGTSIKLLQKLKHLSIYLYDRYNVDTGIWQKQNNYISTRVDQELP